MISQVQFNDQSMSMIKQAMPEREKFDGPGSLEVSGVSNKFAANANTQLPKPGFSS